MLFKYLFYEGLCIYTLASIYLNFGVTSFLFHIVTLYYINICSYILVCREELIFLSELWQHRIKKKHKEMFGFLPPC